MALSEIEKLERRYAENPQGLTFAPLAEVHRKNGEVQRALDLLGPGLALHPDYIPASIVLGRCHLDLGDVAAAEKAFLHVLSLDGENVIALKALADISERLLKFDDADRWLNTLLSVDRSNDEAREQLHRVGIAKRQAGVASAAEPDSVLEPDSLPEPESGPEPEPAAEVAREAPAFEAPVAEPAVGWVSQSSEQAEAPSPALDELEPSGLRDSFDDPGVIPLEEPGGFGDEVQPLEGLVGREVDVPDEPASEFRVETSEDIVLQSSGGGEFQVPDASLELFAATAFRAPAHEETVVPPPAEAASAPPETEREEPAPEPEQPEPASWARWGEPEPLEQESEPEVAVAPEPAAGLGGLAPDPEPETPPREAVPIDHYPAADPVTPAAEPAEAPRRAYAAGDTGGLPVMQFLKGILAARPPAHASAPPVRQAPAPGGSGAPTRPAADALSLSSVFGEDSPGTPPAVPAAGSGAGVSFDDFFGAPGSTPAQRSGRPQDPKNDDLDQFHTWLQNLKR